MGHVPPFLTSALLLVWDAVPPTPGMLDINRVSHRRQGTATEVGPPVLGPMAGGRGQQGEPAGLPSGQREGLFANEAGGPVLVLTGNRAVFCFLSESVGKALGSGRRKM